MTQINDGSEQATRGSPETADLERIALQTEERAARLERQLKSLEATAGTLQTSVDLWTATLAQWTPPREAPAARPANRKLFWMIAGIGLAAAGICVLLARILAP